METFSYKYHHRYELRDWLKSEFPFLGRNVKKQELPPLEQRAEEIWDACRTIRDIDISARSAYVAYYANDWKRIEKAVQDKDCKNLADSLYDLLLGIDVE